MTEIPEPRAHREGMMGPASPSNSREQPVRRRPPVCRPPARVDTRRFARPRIAQAGAPHRFGLGTIMIVTAIYALLVSFLQLLDTPTMVTVFLLGFVSVLGVAQALLFKGRDPRLASVALGTVALPLFIVVSLVFNRITGVPSANETWVAIILGTLSSMPLGAALGYLLGVCVAGVFLVMNRVDRWLAERRGLPVVTAEIVDDAGDN